MSRGPTFIECFSVVISGPIGLLALVGGIAGGGWAMGLGGAALFGWSMYKWHKAIAGYYS